MSEYHKQKTNLTVLIAVWFVAIASIATIVVGQVNSPADNTVVLTSAAAADVSEEVADEQVDEMQIIEDEMKPGAIQSISFKKDMPIKDALRFLALKYQKNIVPSEKVAGNITVTNLYDVTFEEALQAILGTNKYEIQGNFIRVFTLEEFQQDKTRFSHEVITLYYVSAAEAQKLVTPLLSEAGQVAATTAAQQDTEAGAGGDSLAIRDQLVVSDYPERVTAVKEMIKKIDVRPPQILIEVTVLEAKLTETTKFGIDFDTINGAGLADPLDYVVTDILDSTPTGLNVGITSDHFSVFIQALESITDTTVLANPKILALNKQAGKLLIGNEDGYKSSETISEGGNTTQNVDFLETGTMLEFRPFICDDGMIRMEIYPEQSTGSVDVTTGLPEKSTTTVKTNVMVQDGKTIVLGGLFQDKTDLGRQQVPILGDIPVIGNLFRKVNDQTVRTELIILITPHIINEPTQADGAKRLQDAKRLAADARSNIAWMHRAKIAEDRYADAVRYYLDGNFQAALSQISGDKEIDRTCNELERLKEKIINDMQSDPDSIERIMLEVIEKEEAEKWFRK